MIQVKNDSFRFEQNKHRTFSLLIALLVDGNGTSMRREESKDDKGTDMIDD